jgi:hypothetical protein
MNIAVLLIVFILLIGMGVATWYFLQPPAAPKPKGGSGSDSGGGSGSGSGGGSGSGSGGGSGGGSGSGPSVDDCTAHFNIDNTSGCQNASEAGIKWAWNTSAADGVGQGCVDKTVGYNVSVASSWIPGATLTGYIDGGTATTTGIKNVPGKFIVDSDITFTVNPIDKDNNPVISEPVSVTLDRTNISADCSAQGIESQVQDLSFWNNNKYYWPVRVKNNPGSSTNLHVQVFDKNGYKLNDDTYPIPDNNLYYVPTDGKLSISCFIALGDGVEWTYDQLKSKNISQLIYECSTGFFKTNINLISSS